MKLPRITSWRALGLAAACGLFGANLPLASPAASSDLAVPRLASTKPAGTLSVMTWNVHGLPFPVAYGRADALARIARNLADLRRKGREPDVILLQEAFLPEAKAIASLAGYPYVAIGPNRRRAGPDAVFTDDASWLKGETEGNWVDSGLVVMSDFPIERTRAMAFPADACAGYDCLAAKGVLIAWVRVPGRDKPLAIADTHLNSRQASGVAVERANAAYARQVAKVRAFVAREVPERRGLVFGGDFNIGHDPVRIADVREHGGIVTGARAVTALAVPDATSATQSAADIRAVIRRGKDQQYFRPGNEDPLRFKRLTVPFGLANGGFALSDHLGYVVDYAFGSGS